jgi:phage internal scaffolding protein
MAKYFLKEMKMKAVFCRSAYNYDMDIVSDQTGLNCEDLSLTQQQFKEEADINTIVDRFMKSGVLPTPVNMPQYVDYEGVFDFQSAMNAVRAADENFMRMDAKIRARFNNSPQEFLEFFADANNKDEAIRLGLALPLAVAESTDSAAEPTSKSE